MEKNTPDRDIVITITSGTIVRTILFLLLAAGVYFLWDVVLVVLTAIVIASAVEPATRWFIGWGLPRLPSALVVYAGTILLLGSFFYVFIPPILDEAGSFMTTLPADVNIPLLLNPIKEKGPAIIQPGISVLSRTLSPVQLANNIRQALAGVSGSVFNLVSTVFGGLVSLLLMIVLSFYLSVQEDGVSNFLRIVTPLEHEKYVIDLWKRSQHKIGRWMQGQLILAIIVGVLVYLGLTVLGMKYALLLALLAALFELIPVFGPILAEIPALILAFTSGGFTFMLLIAGFYLVVQQFESQLLYPLVVRKVVGVPPLLVILALIIGARLAGFLGLILSVPLAAALREYVNDVEKRKVEEGRRRTAA